MIIYLAKVVEEECYAKEMIQGRLFMNRLSYFQECEDDGRTDPDEACIVMQNDQLGEVTLNSHKLEDVEQIKMQLKWMKKFNIFAMIAGETGPFTKLDEDNLSAFRKYVGFPGQRLQAELGEYCVVIHNTQEFMKRIESACKREGYLVYRGLVKYYDPDHDSVGMDRQDSMDAILRKPKRYSYQKEYRFGVWTGTVGCDPLVLDIGDIHDISCMIETARVNNSLGVSLSGRRRTVVDSIPGPS